MVVCFFHDGDGGLTIFPCQVDDFDAPKIAWEQYNTPADFAADLLFLIHSRFNDLQSQSVADLGCGTGMLAIGAHLLGASCVNQPSSAQRGAQYLLPVQFALSRYFPNWAGCTGRCVTGFDIDEDALRLSERNADRLGVDLDLVQCDVTKQWGPHSKQLTGRAPPFDVVIMNPPFGTRDAGADTAFLAAAAAMTTTSVYSLHKSSTREYLLRRGASWGLHAEVVTELQFPLPRVRSAKPLLDHMAHYISIALLNGKDPFSRIVAQSYDFHRKASSTVEVDLIRLSHPNREDRVAGRAWGLATLQDSDSPVTRREGAAEGAPAS